MIDLSDEIVSYIFIGLQRVLVLLIMMNFFNNLSDLKSGQKSLKGISTSLLPVLRFPLTKVKKIYDNFKDFNGNDLKIHPSSRY